jgi:putative FmdB family regulatory protein
MPTYVYECKEHGEFEEVHSIKEQIEDCPLCKKEGKEPHKVKRLISAGTGFILNGGGWAKEGYS